MDRDADESYEEDYETSNKKLSVSKSSNSDP